MTKKERALLAVEALKKEYPGAVCSLEYQDPLQLLIATRLSAQCTDARVNLVTPALFARFPTLEAFCAGSEEEIAELIRSCGLYKTKARDIFAMCHVLRDSYNGVIPDTVDELTKLPGGRHLQKTCRCDGHALHPYHGTTRSDRKQRAAQSRKRPARSLAAGGKQRLLSLYRFTRQSGLYSA